MRMDRQDNPSYTDQISEAAAYIREKVIARFGENWHPEIGCILGSGLGELGDQFIHPVHVDYGDIPHFPRSTVAGHQGRLVIGEIEGRNVIVMQGRFHYYEGYAMKRVIFPVYVMRELGITSLFVTNAAGGMNPNFAAGDLMLITDHLNLTGDNPLIGPNDTKLGVRFPDMSAVYDRDYRELVKQIAAGPDFADLRLQEGVYAAISGPSYSPPAELRMVAVMGGDAIGMSTVPEATAARHAGLRVLGISCITDMALADELEPLTHEQVMAVANAAKPAFIRLVRAFLRTYIDHRGEHK